MDIGVSRELVSIARATYRLQIRERRMIRNVEDGTATAAARKSAVDRIERNRMERAQVRASSSRAPRAAAT